MNQDIYKQLKTILSTYQFDNTSTFYSLFKFAKQQGLKEFSFKVFVKHARNMGVGSEVRRTSEGVERVLDYDPKADTYIKGLFPVLDTCPNCKGTGLVKIELS